MENLVIREFVENWKANAIKWAKESKVKYRSYKSELSNRRKIEKIDIYTYFNMLETWCKMNGITNQLRNFYDDGYDLEEVYEREAERKYKQFVAKIEKKVGEVEEANLVIGIDGNINGLVKGTKGKALVETILAGGYNIQCLHYRILIK